jgi:polysaccharide deacetylase family protein (PEP-CTERM system associated)
VGVIRHAFSVDVEDYFQVLNFQARLPRSDWGRQEPRVGRNTRVILDLLDEAGAKATFFCLGLVAEADPGLIREIAARGHEVGSHGWSHTPLGHLDPEAAALELRDSRRLLQDLSGQPVKGFRAPSFSIGPRTRWAIDLLIDAGYGYDSSVFPVRHPDYGMPEALPTIHEIVAPSGRRLLEFPMTVVRWGGLRVPVSGGGYFRILPYAVTRWGFRRAAQEGRPGVFYLHPWEVDPGQPDLRRFASRLGALRHYRNLHLTVPRLRCLLAEFSFDPLGEVLAGYGLRAEPVAQ